MILKLQTLTVSLVLAVSAAACQSHPNVPSSQPMDRSVASALFQSETEFIEREAAADAYGMARAARSRLDLIEQISANAALDGDNSNDQSRDRRTETLLASVRDMLALANLRAENDPDTLARIERLFPSSRTAESGGVDGFSGLIGKRRAVKVTIGLELEATLEAQAEESVRLPVNSREGTTIYVQPAGHRYLETSADMTMKVMRRSDNSEVWEPVDCPQTSAARLPCYVPAGDHSEIEIHLVNRSEQTVQALIFVSGNAESVAASLTAE